MHNFKDEKLLVIAPHSDDEILGCGGLISRVKNDGGKVYALILNFLKIDDYHIVHDQADNNRDLDAKPLHSLIEVIETTSNVSLEKIAPTMVAIPTIFSHHQDHIHVHHACIAALRPISTPISNIVLSYEAPEHSHWSASGVFEPNFYVDIEDVLENKIQAFYKYKSQIRSGGRDSDSILNQARYRGQEAGKNLCEAFYAHRFIL